MSKSETNLEFQIFKGSKPYVLNFLLVDFRFASEFEIRISDFHIERFEA